MQPTFRYGFNRRMENVTRTRLDGRSILIHSAERRRVEGRDKRTGLYETITGLNLCGVWFYQGGASTARHTAVRTTIR